MQKQDSPYEWGSQGAQVRPAAMEIIRDLIDRIVVTPGNDRPAVELHGVLARILELCEAADSADKKLPGTVDPGSQFSVVAGPRNHLYRTSIGWGQTNG
jgi:hypothetical protein